MSKFYYSKMLVGWANNVYKNDGPFGVTLQLTPTRRYDNTDFSVDFPTGKFKNAVEARAYLVGGNTNSVTGSSNATANGNYAYVSANLTYLNNSTGWYFTKVNTTWQLRDSANNIIDSSSGNASAPYLETGWTGPLVGATMIRTGASWTITGDAQA